MSLWLWIGLPLLFLLARSHFKTKPLRWQFLSIDVIALELLAASAIRTMHLTLLVRRVDAPGLLMTLWTIPWQLLILVCVQTPLLWSRIALSMQIERHQQHLWWAKLFLGCHFTCSIVL